MRLNMNNKKVVLMKYQIREIVDVAQKISHIDSAFKLVPENIGDPVAKGWPVPKFLKEIIINEIEKDGDKVFGYSHSRGLPSSRKWIAEYSRRFSPSSTLDPENILITSGLGAGISALYHMLPEGRRILQPTPAYPAHASMESFSSGSDPIFYSLDPENDWEPDLVHMEKQITENPEIIGILLINPNNPTGSVYSVDVIEKVVSLAHKYGLMIISDEVYFRMVYNGAKFIQLTETAGKRVPFVILRGISKDVPWPGGRLGWLEFHNTNLDKDFAQYAAAVKKRVTMDVCSVSLPQFILPMIYDHPEYENWIKIYNSELEKNANIIAGILGSTEGLTINKTRGAFYMMPLFKKGVLNDKQKLPINNRAVLEYIEKEVNAPDFPLDKRFTYYLLAATGICVVPSTGFFSPYCGFRLTTLDRDEERIKHTYKLLSSAIKEYILSA